MRGVFLALGEAVSLVFSLNGLILAGIVKTLENRYPIFKAGEAAGTSMCRVLSMKSTVRPFHGPWGAYAPQG